MNTILQKRIEEAAFQESSMYDTIQEKNAAYNTGMKIVTFALQNQWISVDEALPPRTHFLDGEESDKSIYVFVRYKNGAVTSAWYCYCTKIWYFAVGRKGDNSIRAEITHWMPIPQLKGGKDE